MSFRLDTALHRASAWLAVARLNRAQGRSVRFELIAVMAALQEHRRGITA